MTTYKAIAIVDDVNACDCCGKTNLKCTVAMESSDGEVVYFGQVCATRHAGRDLPTIKREIETDRAQRKTAAKREFERSPEYLAREAAFAQARRAGIECGKAFRDATRPASVAADAKRAEIAARYNLAPYEIH